MGPSLYIAQSYDIVFAFQRICAGWIAGILMLGQAMGGGLYISMLFMGLRGIAGFRSDKTHFFVVE